MSNCFIIGDSIAKGVADIRKDCGSYVQSGISSGGWKRKFWNKPVDAREIVISLGTNDLEKENTLENLTYIREAISYADNVLWILPPIKEEKRRIVLQVAENFGDSVLELVKLSPDGIHPSPAGYRAIAKKF